MAQSYQPPYQVTQPFPVRSGQESLFADSGIFTRQKRIESIRAKAIIIGGVFGIAGGFLGGAVAEKLYRPVTEETLKAHNEPYRNDVKNRRGVLDFGSGDGGDGGHTIHDRLYKEKRLEILQSGKHKVANFFSYFGGRGAVGLAGFGVLGGIASGIYMLAKRGEIKRLENEIKEIDENNRQRVEELTERVGRETVVSRKTVRGADNLPNAGQWQHKIQQNNSVNNRSVAVLS